jgi:predicted phosphodiesterase
MNGEETRYAPHRTIPVTSGCSTRKIRVITDTHQDAEGFRKDIFKAFVAEQKRDRDSVWIHTGDLVDSERPSTRHMKKLMYADRGEAWCQEDKRTLDWLDKSIIPQYAPIADSCLGMLDGDHFFVFNNGMTSTEYICRKLKIPYLGERSSFVNLTFASPGGKALQYVIHARHGKGAAPSHGGDVNALVKQEANWIADLHIGGHSHKENCHPERVERVTHRGAIQSRIIWYMRGGSMLDGFPHHGPKTYAYRKEYNPLPVGWGEVELNFGHRFLSKNECRPLEIRMSRASIIAA